MLHRSAASTPRARLWLAHLIGEMGGINTSQGKLDLISALLDTDSETISSISSAKQLVSMLQDKGVDLSALRSVRDSGDLLDVAA